MQHAKVLGENSGANEIGIFGEKETRRQRRGNGSEKGD